MRNVIEGGSGGGRGNAVAISEGIHKYWARKGDVYPSASPAGSLGEREAGREEGVGVGVLERERQGQVSGKKILSEGRKLGCVRGTFRGGGGREWGALA